MKKKYYEIDENIYRRFEQKNEMFCRYLWDKDLKTYQNNFADDMLRNIKKDNHLRLSFVFFMKHLCRAILV